MNYIPSPPPFPGKPKTSYGTKVLLLGLQCMVLMIGALMVFAMSDLREQRNRHVAAQIAEEWGGTVHIQGPVAGNRQGTVRLIRPQTFNCDARVNTRSLHRNIYEAEVFDAKVLMSGTFSKDSLTAIGDTILIEVRLNPSRITGLSPLKIGDKSVEWQKSDDCLKAVVGSRDITRNAEFSTDFDIHGSGGLFIKQIGWESTVDISGDASNPSFSGSRLPNEREIQDRQFNARWVSMDEQIGPAYEEQSGYVGTNFLVGVDRYQKVARALKYSFIIILLTYLSVLLTEMMTGRNIPLLNYFLIGAALIIFYSLLLSFSEHVSFGIAYLIAAAMTVLLITGYMWRMLGAAKVAVIIGLILTGMYVVCYILLTLSTYALLLGSLMLFAALAAVMYASLKLNR